jgi:RNA polymerase sigma factor (sigma-70 family)
LLASPPTPELLLTPRTIADVDLRKLALDEAFSQAYPWLVETARRAIQARAPRGHDTDVAVADVVGDVYVDWPGIVAGYGAKEGSAGGYLSTIIQRKAIDRWRRVQTRTRHLAHSDPDTLGTAAAPPDRILPEELTALQELLDTLSDDERELLELRFGKDLTFQEIAQLRGITLSKAYRVLLEVIEKLRTSVR